MVLIVVGKPGAQCVIELTQVPEIGEILVIKKIKYPLTSPAGLLPRPNKTYKVISRREDYLMGFFFGVLPWFLLEEVNPQH
jgi:hypothetical protein